MRKSGVLILLIEILLSPLAVFAASKFDNCVDALHRSGGLSLRESQEICLQQKPSEKIQQCQNRLFQIAFRSPQVSLQTCLQNAEADALYREGEFYRGQFEPLPDGGSGKKTVCSITVNSEEERESFRKLLPSSNYNFVELLPAREAGRFINRDFHWLERACNAGVRCDTMVLSGHFADSFIGDAGFEVSMAGFEKHRALPGCADFFASIKEVYLFGCNTLASKKPDHRTIDQYVGILIVDGVAPHTAQRIAARRYTPYDKSVAEKMTTIFSSAAFVAGYPSTGPTGAHIRPTLENYLAKAYRGEMSEAQRASVFKQTLGQTGMITVAPSAQPKSAALSAEQIRRYVQTYGAMLPVPTVDLLVNAASAGVISAEQFAALSTELRTQWRTLGAKAQQQRLCPLLLTENESWVPAELPCTSDTQWLRE